MSVSTSPPVADGLLNMDEVRVDPAWALKVPPPLALRRQVLPFAVVVLRAESNRFDDTHPLMPEVVRRLPGFRPGRVYILPSAD